jgi:hypothetical protein
MPTETKKRNKKRSDHETEVISQKDGNDGTAPQISDFGDNHFRPDSNHRGNRDNQGQAGGKDQRRGPQGNRGNKSEPEKGAHQDREQDHTDEQTGKS